MPIPKGQRRKNRVGGNTSCAMMCRVRAFAVRLESQAVDQGLAQIFVVRRLLGRCIAARCVCAGRRGVCVVLAYR